jgi:hypothetical protein
MGRAAFRLITTTQRPSGDRRRRRCGGPELRCGGDACARAKTVATLQRLLASGDVRATPRVSLNITS